MSMHAVVLTGGKQYRVKQGQIVRVEKIEAETGANIKLEKVLMLSDGENFKIGAPYLEGAQVEATILRHGRAKKVKIIKFKRRKHHMKHMGHRQWFTDIRVITLPAL